MDEVITRYIVVYGNLSDGFQFFGPYDSFDDADEASRYLDVHRTWIASLYQNIHKDQP